MGVNNDSFEILTVEKGVYCIRTLLLDKKAKFECNLIIVYADAQNVGKATYMAEISRIYHDNAAVPCLMGGGLQHH